MALPNEDLYQLIRVLTPSEKRYFKLFAQRQGDDRHKLYMQIFDLIDRMKDGYDEALLKKKLRSPAAIRQLPQIKPYLFDLIMKSMRLYRTEKDVVSEVFDLIQDELFYTEKGLREQRIKAIRRAKAIAYKYDLMYLLVALIRRERVYAMKFPDEDPFLHLAELHHEEASVFDRLTNETLLGEVFYGLHALHIKDPTLREEIALPAFHDNLRKVAEQTLDDQKTFLEKFYWLRVQALQSRVSRDYVSYYEFSRQLVNLFVDYPQHRMNVMGNYMDALSNHLGAGHFIGKYDDYEHILGLLSAIQPDAQKDRHTIDSSVFQYRMLWYMNTGQLQRTQEIIEGLARLEQEYGDILSDSARITYNFNIAVMLFFNEQFNESLRYLDAILNKNSPVKVELQHGARLLQLLVHYELHNVQYFDSVYRSSIRTMKQMEKYGDFEHLLCTYLRKLCNSAATDRKGLLQELFEQLLQLKKSTDRRFILIDEVLSWCNARLNKKPLAQTAHQRWS